MKFIFPKNYNFKNKLLGIIDYPTAIINVILFIIIYKISALIFISLINRFIILILFYFPFLLISIFFLFQMKVLFLCFIIFLDI